MYSIPSAFPDLLWLSFYAAFLLRLALGSFFIFEGYSRLRKNLDVSRMRFIDKWGEVGARVLGIVSVLEVLLGVSLFLGLGTQVAALVVLIYGVWGGASLYNTLGHERVVYKFLAVIALSLLLTGAGPFAFDLPL